ncbi:uncharacterized protein LOC119771252 isoform X1 [Culex quinquefasciatus]|uniref:uncharacterized protein LOC119771252 isoform X1 n=1 Tax=Culex quinquefasciatus TaxID=7176 RepID=UPI0018E2CE9D|nr:uncharacterized protein LOC119771252 isoform X1 [Culex quinquefasciatus]
MSYSNLVFCAQLLVTTVVLLQSCGTWTVVSGAVWTPSTTTTATVAIAMTTAQPLATTTVVGGNASVASSITSGPPAVVRGANREGRAWSFGMMQKYDLPGELGQPCSGSDDCRQFAYECDEQKRICECADGYQPDQTQAVCVGAVGRRCYYDSHCIANAFCKGQMVCTCKREFGYLSADKWSCQASSASSLLLPHRKFSSWWSSSMGLLRGAAAIVISLLLVSISSGSGSIWQQTCIGTLCTGTSD